jgi:hypothetical protein
MTVCFNFDSVITKEVDKSIIIEYQGNIEKLDAYYKSQHDSSSGKPGTLIQNPTNNPKTSKPNISPTLDQQTRMKSKEINV